MPAQLAERDETLHLTHQLDDYHEPARLARVALRIVVIVLGIEGGLVGITLLDHTNDACDARNVAARVIEEGGVALLHRLPEHVPRLIVAYAVPGSRLLGPSRK